MKKLTILVSSKGKNVDLGNVILDSAKKNGFDAAVINLVDLNLPLYTTVEEEKGIPEKAVELANTLIASDSLVFVAPEYNGSIPPVLNNAVSWVSRSGDDWRNAFNGKATLIATHSGGGGAHVCIAMRQQLAFLGANVLGRQLITNYSKELNMESLESCLTQL